MNARFRNRTLILESGFCALPLLHEVTVGDIDFASFHHSSFAGHRARRGSALVKGVIFA